ncbi:ABC transporter ATP-binding protein [Desulfuribacillus alkaliarsenatis]|uniref:Multidrug ABC transporter ATP-binding protein n=1 Tax=Desulfuribacillus alkaliarsenatis TaxID=766136 RepID=A0A1E5G3A2_9FIRM|nr:ABC transporter ATP-binding protein [Desulfuribacillus alkaliarsenatis]OEF97450.1 multidrug ABC transporter ATP-binding protein [Desulfuribacillus alkaliarsenatis]
MLAILKYIKPYKYLIALIMVFTLIAIMLELYLPTLMADVVDVGIVNEDVPFIIKTGGWMVLFAFFAVLFTIAVAYISNRVALGFARDIRRRLFVKIESFSLQEFERVGPASLITRSTNDIKQIQDVVNMMLRMMTRAPLMLVGGIIMAVSREPVLSLVFLVAMPILVGSIVLIARKAIPLFGLLQKRTDRLNLLLRETLSGIRVIRAFNRVNFEKARFTEANNEYRDTGVKVNRIIAVVFPIMLITMNFTNIAIVWFGAIRIDQGAMQVGNLMAFLQYAMMILMSLIMMSYAFIMIPRAQASAERINEVLNIQAKITDSSTARKLVSDVSKLEFRNVTFHYEGAEKPALDNISFQAKAGETIAIIGSTGAGKSTLVQLILRYYDIDIGKIMVGDTDIRDVKIKDLRNKIGYVPQKASLFSGTIAENVRFGKDDATDTEVIEALKTAQAMEFIEVKEEGIHSHISQAGANLSGGQKQRLAIARALVRKVNIYIFDDSFSALDYKTDARLRHALKQKIEDAIVIIVAQRVRTVMNADRIILLNEGKLVGNGTHEELLKDNSIYQEIVASQQTEGESA